MAGQRNVEFKQAKIEELREFLRLEGIEKQVDLFSIGQGLHWLPIAETLNTMNSLLDKNQHFLILGYAKPFIFDGANLDKQIKDQAIEEKGYQLVRSVPDGYSFNKN